MPFKVWICIEHEKPNGDYVEMDAPGASLSVFSRYNKAYAFAEALQDTFEGCDNAEYVRGLAQDEEAITTIFEALSGKEWNSNTLEVIAEAVRSTGRKIKDAFHCPDPPVEA